MKRGLYVIRDRIAEYSGPVFQGRNDNDAVRQFFQALGSKGTTLNEHPQDFELIKVGEQDEETGRITPEYVQVTNGDTYREAQRMSELDGAQLAQVH